MLYFEDKHLILQVSPYMNLCWQAQRLQNLEGIKNYCMGDIHDITLRDRQYVKTTSHSYNKDDAFTASFFWRIDMHPSSK